MNHLKKASIVGVLVLAAMATVGVGSAAAAQSTFCKANETPCGSGNHYPVEADVVFTGKGAIKWVMPLRTIECSGAKFLGDVTKTGSSSEEAEISFHTQTFSNLCNCPFSTLENAKMKVDWTSGTMNGSVITTGFAYSFTCSGVTCAYGGEIKEGTVLTGGNPAVLAFNKASVPKISGGFLCGTAAELSGEFEVSTPKPLYVSNG
jgi:hypothetical protein